ncbi:hypothetical protein VISI1226_04964 [Vibrio sinaloensis DSM 21326]|uniref:DUF2909 domain-containing protein n=1 Tax=Vibrio sinaloensis DSM 21326 TaxID=945550 RepID=E8M1E7_PHOS4|nr:DUF2909 domain-containing protein [Vibrio sinaloensis]EGA72127.1 hypothetical protein VISI1226_04964 [Vibrio sinaloensis DSM 21326]MDN3684909.1 DUF2909 domain-containing protein [Vibrio sinaloensis]
MVFIFKLLLVVLLLFIIVNLGRAMIEMVKDPKDDQEGNEQDKPMSFYLGRRVFLSALAVILMVAALLSGFIDPNTRPY